MPGKTIERQATGEFLSPEVGFERAQRYAADSRDQLERVAAVLVRNARILHKATHPMLEGGMEKCRQVTCREVRAVLGQT